MLELQLSQELQKLSRRSTQRFHIATNFQRKKNRIQTLLHTSARRLKMKFARRAANVQTAKRKPSVGDTQSPVSRLNRMNGDELEKAHIKGQLQGLRAALRQQPGSARQLVQKPQPPKVLNPTPPPATPVPPPASAPLPPPTPMTHPNEDRTRQLELQLREMQLQMQLRDAQEAAKRRRHAGARSSRRRTASSSSSSSSRRRRTTHRCHHHLSTWLSTSRVLAPPRRVLRHAASRRPCGRLRAM